MQGIKRYIRDVELADLSGIPLPTLRWDRQYKRQLPFIKIGRSVYYDTATIFEHIAEKFGNGGESKLGLKVTASVRKRRVMQSSKTTGAA
jgi:hypothetical protein